MNDTKTDYPWDQLYRGGVAQRTARESNHPFTPFSMKIQIKSWLTGSVLFEHEAEVNSVAITLKEAINSRADLTGAILTDAILTDADLTDADLTDAILTGAILTRADLTGADLTDANLTRANLTRANLTDANLTGANLTGANLTGADLTDANLTGANLTRANLTDAILTGADLTRANLTGANLTGANLTRANLTDAILTGADLTRANLTDANLRVIKHDIWGVLMHARTEVPGLLLALKEGRVDGSIYNSDCACLMGTIGNVLGCRYDQIPGIEPDSDSPAERWFLAIRPGHLPETSPIVRQTIGWIDDFVRLTGPATSNAV